MPNKNPAELFEVFNEIGIIEQLSRTILEARLPSGLLAPHFGVLNHLIRVADGRTPVELARAFQVPKTTMTHTLKGLVDRKLVEMRPNPKDGRSKRIWLTDTGRDLRNDIIVDIGTDFMAFTEMFGFERLRDMLPELRALRIFLDENRALTGTDGLKNR